MTSDQLVLYTEKQHYSLNKLWLIYLVVGFPLLGIIVFSSYEQMYHSGSIAQLDDNNMVFFLINGGILIVLLLIPIFISALVLNIQVYPHSLEIKLGPWLQRSIRMTDLVQADVITINRDELLKEYGKRGPAWQLKSINTYNIKGDKAVRIKLTDGRKIFLGSQRPAELESILNRQAGLI